jgi:hypothetical protein
MQYKGSNSSTDNRLSGDDMTAVSSLGSEQYEEMYTCVNMNIAFPNLSTPISWQYVDEESDRCSETTKLIPRNVVNEDAAGNGCGHWFETRL